jgi:hypothetical protein
MVKPVNRDDLPPLPNVESLKKGSLLGIDRKEGQIDGPSGFILKSGSATSQPEPDSTAPAAPAKETVPAVTPVPTTKAAVPTVSLAQPSATGQEVKTPNP